MLGVYDGAAAIINRAHTRTDNLNLTNVWDNVVAANHQSFWYTATNRLQNAGGPWGDLTFYYDGVGNRTYRILDDAGVTATQTFGYPAASNLIGNEEVGGTTTRTFTHDAAGNMTRDVRVADTYDYAINHAGRISEVKINSVVSADYVYNAQNQLVFRSTTVVGGPSGNRHYVYDRAGRLIAEADAATGNTVREYIRLADMPIAVVADVDTASPLLYYVHVDHLNRPIMMTDELKANVWEAVWLPYGAIHSITGTASSDARFPGQWFQIETGLHYNWHRHYDPTLARYTQADPLGFDAGISLFAYALNSPLVFVDQDGRMPDLPGGVGPRLPQTPNPRIKLPPGIDFPPKTPKGTPTVGIPQRLPRGRVKATCERWLFACMAGCATSKWCKRIPPVRVACTVSCTTSFALCAGLKHFSEIE